MSYIVERNTRFYVVAYDGLDPLTGRERRRWIPIGQDRIEAEAVAARLDSERTIGPPPHRGTVTVGEFLTPSWQPTWLPDAVAAIGPALWGTLPGRRIDHGPTASMTGGDARLLVSIQYASTSGCRPCGSPRPARVLPRPVVADT